RPHGRGDPGPVGPGPGPNPPGRAAARLRSATMRSRRVVANVVGVAGCALFGYAMHGFMISSGCGGLNEPACPSIIPNVIGFPGGMLLAFVAAFLGAQWVLRHAFLLVAGLSC